jgi:RNA polymerase sigma-70 factor (ECF subfamily)
MVGKWRGEAGRRQVLGPGISEGGAGRKKRFQPKTTPKDVSFPRLEHIGDMADDVDFLIRQIRAGETERYAEIVRRFERPVWRVVAALLQDFEQSREVQQQVFVAAYLHLDQFEIGRDFEFWIKAIARNCVRQELRRLSRQSSKLSAYWQILERRWADSGAAEQLELEYLAALAACREQLPPRSGQAILWRYEHGKSFDEIGRLLETSREAAEKLLSRVRQVLRECIESKVATA